MAAKPKRRPPFTTLATRLMPTSFSINSLSSRSARSPRGPRSPSPRPRGGRSPPPRLRGGLSPVEGREGRSPADGVVAMLPFLEIEAARAGGVGQGLHPAMKEIAAAIEDDGGDAGGLGALGEELADGFRRFLVGAGLAAAQRLIEGRCRGQRVAGDIVDDLRVDVPPRAEHREPRPALVGARETRAHAPPATFEKCIGFAAHRLSLLLLLAFLAADRLVIVFDALALIGLGTAERADHRRDLTDALLVGAADRDRGRLLARDFDIGRDGKLDVVTV